MKQRVLQNLLTFLMLLFLTMMGFCQSKINRDKNPITVPLDLSTQRPILELMINGTGPYRFIFDTGSSTNVIDQEIADKLSLEVIGEDSLQTQGSDNKLTSERVLAPNLTLSGIEISEEVVMNTMAIKKLVSVDGVLSANVLADYLVTVDYPNSKLILFSGGLNKADNDVISFTQENNIVQFNVFIDGNKLEAHLDSGNPGGFDIPFSVKDKLHFKSEPSEDGVINTPVASFKKLKAVLDGDIKIANVTYANPDLNLVKGFQFVNIGFSIIKDLRITIDKKNNLIKFEKSSSATEINDDEEYLGDQNDYTGWYGDHTRKIFIESGKVYLQRGAAPKLKLAKIGKDKFEMVLDMPVKNELPIVHFERDETNKVTGLKFVFKDGREDFVKKDK